MTAAPQPEPRPDPAEELVFHCLESDDPDRELRAAETGDPALAAEARKMLAILADKGMLHDCGSEPELPARLGPYALVQKLGEGGMGLVVEARDSELDRRVAIKLIRPDMLPFAKTRQRFENEIQALAKLEHPGIARVLRAGEEDGLRYYAMELVDGESLAEILRRLQSRQPAELFGRDLFGGKLERVDAATSECTVLLAASWADACARIVRDTALALAHAHGCGILHRDVKPANVMLGRDGRARLLDFGLARADDAPTMTRSGVAIGSLAYMAPEQVRGDRDAVDARSDVYALGVVLCELLTLRSPFLVPDNAEATQQNILRGRARRPRCDNPAIGTALERVCHKAIARDPSRRYATAAELADDLTATLAGGRLHADSRVRRLVQEHPIACGGVAIAGLAGALGLAVAYGQATNELGTLRAENAAMVETAAAANADTDAARVLAYGGLLRAAQGELAAGQLEAAQSLLARTPASQRSWTWSHLNRRSLLDARDHPLPFVSSGAWLIAAGRDLVAVNYAAGQSYGFLDPATGVAHRGAHDLDRRRALGRAMSADASTYAVVPEGDPASIVVCDLASETRRTLPLDRDYVGVSLSADGARAALRASRGPGVVVDTATGSTLGRFETDGQSWSSAGLSPDGERLAVSTVEGELFVWDVAPPNLRWRKRHSGYLTTYMLWSPNGEEVRTIGLNTHLECWRATDGHRTLRLWTYYTARQADCRFMGQMTNDPDGDHIWTTASDGLVHCLHLPSRRWVATVPGHPLRAAREPMLAGMTIDRHRNRLLVSSRYRELWSHDLGAIKSRWLHAGRGLVRATMNSRGDLLAVATKHAPTLRRAGEEPRPLGELPSAHRALFVDDDLAVIAPIDTGDLLLYDIARGEIAGELEGHSRPVHGLALLGDLLASGSESGSVRLWDLESRACVRTFHDHRNLVGEIAPLPDGERFASASFDGTVVVAAIDGTRTRPILRDAGELYALSISPDGRWLATGGQHPGVRLVDLRENRELPRRLGDQKTSAVAFTPDGRRLIVASHQSALLEVFDVPTRQHVTTLGPDHGERIHFAAFAPDQRTLITSDYGALVRLWPSDG